MNAITSKDGRPIKIQNDRRSNSEISDQMQKMIGKGKSEK